MKSSTMILSVAIVLMIATPILAGNKKPPPAKVANKKPPPRRSASPPPIDDGDYPPGPPPPYGSKDLDVTLTRPQAGYSDIPWNAVSAQLTTSAAKRCPLGSYVATYTNVVGPNITGCLNNEKNIQSLTIGCSDGSTLSFTGLTCLKSSNPTITPETRDITATGLAGIMVGKYEGIAGSFTRYVPPGILPTSNYASYLTCPSGQKVVGVTVGTWAKPTGIKLLAIKAITCNTVG